jgi:hypothetical protein
MDWSSGWVTTALWWLGVAVCASSGVVVVVALFRDRSRGRRRCPRCWYEMTGVPGLVCPECGKAARREKSLFRTRRRWRMAGVAALVAGLGLAGALTPRARERGWRSLVSTPVLLLFAPPRHEMMWMDSTGRQREDLFAKELWSRFDRPGAPAWQWRMALNSATFMRTRPTWAVDEPFAVRLNLPEWMNVGSVELEPAGMERSWRLVVSSVSARRAWHAIGYVTPGVEQVRVRVTLRSAGWGLNAALATIGPPTLSPFPGGPTSLTTNPNTMQAGDVLYEGTFVLRVRAVATLEESMTRVSGERIDAMMREAMTVRVGWDAEGSRHRPVKVNLSVDRTKLREHAMIALPVIVEVARDGVVVEAERVSLGNTELAMSRDRDKVEVRLPASLRRELETPGPKKGWEIRIRGDLGEMHQQWQRETYWVGEVVVPLDEAMKSE